MEKVMWLALLLVMMAAAGWLLKEMGLFKGVPGQAKVEPLQARPVLTANEWEFFGRLREALPGHVVCPQVSMAAVLVTRPGLSRAEATTARNRFDRKVVDFVILNQAGATVALVELDDRTHAADRDAARDAMTAAAGLRTIRYSSRAKPDLAKIAADVAGLGAAAA